MCAFHFVLYLLLINYIKIQNDRFACDANIASMLLTIGQTGGSSKKEKGGKPCCFAFIGIIIDY